MSRSASTTISRHTVDAAAPHSQHDQQAARRIGDPGHAQPATSSNHAIGQALGSGVPLEPHVRAEMEQRFGTSFADVRVHDDVDAHASAAALEAKAYTHANHIVFGRERYAPRSAGGIRLLAHELAHVLQQRRGGPAPELDPAAAHEHHAEQAANEAANGSWSITVGGSTGVGIAREPDDDKPKKTAKPTSKKSSSDKTSTGGKAGGSARDTRKAPKPRAKPRTPDAEFADFKKMLADEFGAKGPVTSDKLLQLYRHGSRATVVKYLKQYLMKQAATTGEMTLGDVSAKVEPGVPLDKQVDAFIKNLEGAHSTPQTFGKKLPKDVGKDLPAGKYNPDDALVALTGKPTHTAMDQPWKDAFNNIRKSGVKEATAQEVFDAVADGIRRTPGMNTSDKNSRIARLHDEMFGELGLEPHRKYPIPRIVKWWEILAAKAKRAAKSKAPQPAVKAKPTTPRADKDAKPATKAAAKPKSTKAAPIDDAAQPPAKAKPTTPRADKNAKPATKAAAKPKPAKAAPIDDAAPPAKAKPTTTGADKKAKLATKAAAKPKPAKAAPIDDAAQPSTKTKPTTPRADKKPAAKAPVEAEPIRTAPAKNPLKATPQKALKPATEPVSPAKPTPHAVESSATPASEKVPPKPGARPGSGEGGGGALFSVALQLFAGWIHDKAVAKRIEKQAKEKGWVPYGAPSGEGWLYDLGAWFIDPSNEADKNVPFEKRFQIAPWRQRIREAANAKKPGETLDFDWQIGICKTDFMGRWKTITHRAVYLKNADGRWSMEGGEIWGIPSMNDIISEEVPDSQLEKAIYADPCYQSDRDYTKGST
jgi:hypothetical protein